MVGSCRGTRFAFAADLGLGSGPGSGLNKSLVAGYEPGAGLQSRGLGGLGDLLRVLSRTNFWSGAVSGLWKCRSLGEEFGDLPLSAAAGLLLYRPPSGDWPLSSLLLLLPPARELLGSLALGLGEGLELCFLPFLDFRFCRCFRGLASLLPSCLLLLALVDRRERLRVFAGLVFLAELEDLGTIAAYLASSLSAAASLRCTALFISAILAIASWAIATACSFCTTLFRSVEKVEGTSGAATSVADGIDLPGEPASVVVVE